MTHKHAIGGRFAALLVAFALTLCTALTCPSPALATVYTEDGMLTFLAKDDYVTGGIEMSSDLTSKTNVVLKANTYKVGSSTEPAANDKVIEVAEGGTIQFAEDGSFSYDGTTYAPYSTSGVCNAWKVVDNDPFSSPSSVSLEGARSYSINVSESAGGKVKAIPAKAPEGEEVFLDVQPNDGYELETLTYKTAGRDAVDVKDAKKFTMPKGDVTVSASFKPITYTIKVKDGIEHGKVTVDKSSAIVGEKVVARAIPDDGYVPYQLTAGSSKGSTVTTSNVLEFVMPASNVEVSVNFRQSKDACIVSFDKNGEDATGTMADLAIESGTSVSLPANAYARTGYTFDGWNTKADGTGTSFKNGATVGFTENTTLYAQWKKESSPTSDTVTFTFDANGGTGSMDPMVVTKGETVTLTKNAFARPGYTFVGWNLAADGSSQSYKDEQSVIASFNGTLYAQWKKGDYPAPEMKNSRKGSFISTSEEITYTVTQDVPDYAKSLRTWVDLEDVLQFSSDEVVVATSDGAAVGSDVATVSFNGQRLTVTVDDATSLQGKTLQISYKARLVSNADLSPYMNSDGTVASVPYQAHTVFDGSEDDVKSSTVEYVKFRVSKSSSSTSRTTGNGSSSTSTKSSSTLAKTSDPMSFVSSAAMAVAGAATIIAGRRKRR